MKGTGSLFVDACQNPPHAQAKDTAYNLECKQAQAQALLCAGTKHMQRQVDQIPVWRCMQQASGRLKARQPMPGAGHNLEQLRQRVRKVQDLCMCNQASQKPYMQQLV